MNVRRLTSFIMMSWLMPLALWAEYQYNITLCAIFQNEAPYLNEWISYHIHHGVDHIYLYNSDSTDEYHAVVDPWVNMGLVTLEQWPNLWPDVSFPMVCQCLCYTDCLNKTRGKAQWVGFIDIDEYLVPMRNSNIRNLMHRYRKFESVSFQWLCFGTSGIYQVPQGQMLKMLIHRAKVDYILNGYFKTFVKPDACIDCTNPHFCNLISGKETHVAHRSMARINHYWTKDEKFLNEVKIPRYIKWGLSAKDVRKIADTLNEVEDTEIHRLL